jgi:hypothetical protein
MLYIVIVNDGEIIRECVVLDNFESAANLLEVCMEIWGDANVCLAMKKINEIPAAVIEHLALIGAHDNGSPPRQD